ncbi:MAG: enoyl-CoA hydratase/isomerase [Gammaproteobacteria bacterium]|jgi:isohexenylglutaconyl-CoA hydratase|nr:enoyl-CoA hydratase/isomerase [Gammaproteobacteria bacterium]
MKAASVLPKPPLVRVERHDIALFVTLDDRSTRNAMSEEMIAALCETATSLRDDPARCLVLRGANGAFCSGGDINRFAEDAATVLPLSGVDSVATANRAFGHVLELLDAAPQLVIALVEGSVFGGGCGLVCASDLVIATADSRFALSETTLGIVPAQISPFVVRRVGVPCARHLTMTGARFDGRKAAEYGFVDVVCSHADELEAELGKVLQGVARCAPKANARTKALFAIAAAQPATNTLDAAAGMFAAALRDEGREGAAAFLEKRPAAWAKKEG